jgi:hypothetical protein
MESIIDKRIRKKTRRKEYFQYLVNWKGHPVGRMKQRFIGMDRPYKIS